MAQLLNRGTHGILCVPDGHFYSENVKRVTQQKKKTVKLTALMDSKTDYDIDSQGRDNYNGLAAEVLSAKAVAEEDVDVLASGSGAPASGSGTQQTQETTVP